MIDDDDLDSVTDGATPIGVTDRASAFEPSETLWRCDTCQGVFWFTEQKFIVGVELIDHHFTVNTDSRAETTLTEEQLERIRRRTEADRHNAALRALHDASPRCNCDRFGHRHRGHGTHGLGDGK